MEFDGWSEKRQQESPQFQYWNNTLEMILTILRFIRSEHQGDLGLYTQSLSSMAEWMFALAGMVKGDA